MNSDVNKIPRVLITMGEPAGIGPELLVRAALLSFDAELVFLADECLLQKTAEQLKLEIQIQRVDWELPPAKHRPGIVLLEPVFLEAAVLPGQLNVDNAPATLAMLEQANELALAKKVDAIVTAPVHKANLNRINPQFLGHTEFFAKSAGVGKVVMMLASGDLRITLATTHLPLSEVPSAITQSSLQATLKIILAALGDYGIETPSVAVCGLNPHAGEEGLLGNEDRDVIKPVIEELALQGHAVYGPLPADTVFTPQKRKQYDVVLAMYHDQGLPVVKAFGFGQCANVTLGLPYVRTSVDHGTALDIADTYSASAESLEYAINYAIELVLGNLPQ